MRIFTGPADLKAAVGQDLGASDWVTVDRGRIDRFACAVGGPPGQEVADGSLALALIPTFVPQVFRVDNARMGVNYGFDRVEFLGPVPEDARVRGRCTFAEVADVPGGVQVTNAVVIELDGSTQPACVADLLVRYYF